MKDKKADNKVIEVEPVKLTDEQIAVLEQEKAALVASLMGKPSAVVVTEPVAQSAGKGEPVIVVEPVPDEAALLSQLKALQDQKVALQVQQEAQASALEQAERTLIAKLGQAQAAIREAEAAKLRAGAGGMVDSLSAADAAHAAGVALSQKKKDKALREEFAPHQERVEKINSQVATFAKLYQKRLHELAREDEDGYGPEDWDARLRVAYRGKVGLPNRDLLRVLAHHRLNIPALIADLKSFLAAGVRQSDQCEGERAELHWRCRQVQPEYLRDLDNDVTVILAALKDLLKKAEAHSGPVTKLEVLPIPASLRGPDIPKTTSEVGIIGAPKKSDKYPAKSETDWDPHA
jgi:hypothetical protein